MGADYKVLTPLDLGDKDREKQTFGLDVLIGLSERPKRLKSKYFYDDQGSLLFQEIMSLPEYYLTDAELEIFQTQGHVLSEIVADEGFNLVELGAGDGLKTSVLIDTFLKDRQTFEYVPIDISEAAMSGLRDTMRQKFPVLEMRGLVAEYFDALEWLSQNTTRRTLVLFLGSNLGNFYRAETRVFLRSLWNAMNHGDCAVIGFDLKKDIDQMLAAYNDSKGITAAFNLNLLKRINRQLGGNFDIDRFRFFSTYNVFSGAIESYLVSLIKQRVSIKAIGQSFDFNAWEPIHTEYSYKYLDTDITRLAAETGFSVITQLYDSQKRFVDSVWRVEKG